MSQSPGPEPTPSSGGKHRWGRIGLTAGSVVVLVGAGAALAGWVFLNERLSPILEAQLSESLGRPVEVGELERLTLSKLRFGPSVIPPTATDPDTAAIASLEVRFNLLQLFDRELRLDVVVNQADVYVEQSANGRWIDLDLDRPEPDREPFIEVRPGNIRLSNSQISALPYIPDRADVPEIPDRADVPEEQRSDTDLVAFADVDGVLRFQNADFEDGSAEGVTIEAQRLEYEVAGESVRQGRLELEGSAFLPPAPETLPESVDPLGREIILTLRPDNLRATDIMPVVRSFYPRLPVDITDGLLSGSATLEVAPDQPFTIVGTAQVSDAAVAVPRLPVPVSDIDGMVRFQGRQIAFENVTAELGELAAQAGGSLDFAEGYDFSGQFEPFTIAEIQNLFDFELPVDTDGRFTAEVTMTGALGDPIVSADIAAQGAATVDRIDLAQLTAQVEYRGRGILVEQLTALPAAGGRLTGRGRYQFNQPRRLSLTAVGENLPADAIARAYGLPEAIALGPVSLEADISGSVGNLQGLVDFRAPTADYPARGTIEFAGDTISLRDTVITVAGGTVRGGGTLVDGRFQTDFRAQDIQLEQLRPGLEGTITGAAQLAGSLADFSLAGLRGQGDFTVATPGGTLAADASLASGRFSADLQTQDLQLAALSDQLQGLATGQITLAGNVEDLSLAGLQGEGNLVLSEGLATLAPVAPRLAEVQEPLSASVLWDGSVLTVQQAQTAGIRASGTITPRLEDGFGIANIDLGLQIEAYSLAALPLPAAASDIAPLAGQASFQGRLTGAPPNLTLSGEAQLADVTLGDLAFETPLTGPVRVALGDGVDVDLQGPGEDAIQVSYGFDQRRLAFNIRADQAIAVGQTEGNIFTATVSNFPLAVLNLPGGGIPGFGSVSGTVEQAAIRADLSQPAVRVEFAIANPGLGYLNFRGLPTVVDGVVQERDSRFEGTFTFANGTAALTQGQLSTGSSLYLVNVRYSPEGTPALRGQVSVEEGQLQDVLSTLQFFQLSDFGRGLKPPEWARDYSPEELEEILDTMAAGNPGGSFLNQLRRISELLEIQDQEALAEEGDVLPPLAELRGEFSGDIRFAGSLPSDLEVEFDLAGDDWRWGPNYFVDTVVAEGRYDEGILQLSPLRLASDPVNPDSFVDISGAVALSEAVDDPRTLSFTARNVPLDPLEDSLDIPTSFGGILNANATFSGPLTNPQLRGALEVVNATINNNPVEELGADFLYQDARFNLASALVVEDADNPLRLTASIPYRLPFADQMPASDQLLVDLAAQDKGLLLLNLLNNQVAIQSGEGAIALAVRGRWPDGEDFPQLASLDLTGSAQLEEVTLTTRALAEPLTDVDASLRFRDDLIIVERLRGDFSDGEILAQGTFPILTPLDQRFRVADPSINPLEVGPNPEVIPADVALMPLVVDLNNIALDFKGIYNGLVDGRVLVGGSAVVYGPTLGGAVELSQGRLSLPNTGANGDDGGSAAPPALPEGGGLAAIRFDDFALSLEEGTRIQVGGIVDVAARGTIITNGILPDIQPVGRVQLPSGRINLLTTEFRIRGDENYAEFRPSLGIEPYINATLQATVPDATGPGATSLTTATPFPRNEIADPITDQLGLNRSGIETVRIRAEVEGPAFQVAQLRGVSLRSTPPRSEGEIITLISGGVLTALESTLGSVGGEGDNFEGLITLAGSTLLNQLQGILGDSLDISELRLYSATPESVGETGDSIDIGGEIGFEISPDISLGIQKTFTDVSPFQFNVRYRINNQFTLRGTTSYEDFTENSGLLLEYETRF